MLRLVRATVAAVALCWSPWALAETKVVVAEFEGRKADVLRQKVVTSLEAAGHTVTLGDLGSDLSSSDAKELAQRTSAQAVVTGVIERPGIREWLVTMSVRDGETGGVIQDEIVFRNTWLPGLSKDLIDTTGDRLAGALDQLSGVEDAEGSASDSLMNVDPEVIPEADSGAPIDSPASEDGGMFRIRARAGWMRRVMGFADDIYGRLTDQNANSWVYGVDAAVYPFARPVGDRLGIIASYEGILAGSVDDPRVGVSFDNTYYELFAGLRARYPIDDNELGFDLTFGRMHAGLDASSETTQLPNVDYTAVRAALHGMLSMGPAQLALGAGFRLPVGYGEIAEENWFPRIGGYGVEANAALVYPLGRGAALEASGTLRRFVLEANAEPEDAVQGVAETAAGAIDLYLTAFFGMSFRL